ncbi:MAG: TdeIII family type II restriction endonuclease [Bacteroidales bacterium]|jgi:type II restriction enzyme|nr:TdeIII family type II restriction endonuclease [Bacteroidales bacterium]
MALNNSQKTQIQQVIANCLRSKFQNYESKDNYMPFHFRLLGKDRLALYSFMQSLLTTFGTSIFEPVAAALAKTKFAKVETQYVVGNAIFSDCLQSVQAIINELTIAPKPDKIKKLKLLKQSLSGTINNLKPAKPNKGDFQKYKQTLLEWAGIAYTTNKHTKVHTLIAIPYNPYEPQPYQFWTLAGMLDLEEELMVAEKFWDFFCGEGAHTELLECLKKAGIELRPEIDAYFARFNKSLL